MQLSSQVLTRFDIAHNPIFNQCRRDGLGVAAHTCRTLRIINVAAAPASFFLSASFKPCALAAAISFFARAVPIQQTQPSPPSLRPSLLPSLRPSPSPSSRPNIPSQVNVHTAAPRADAQPHCIHNPNFTHPHVVFGYQHLPSITAAHNSHRPSTPVRAQVATRTITSCIRTTIAYNIPKARPNISAP